ncbi:MAG TPA: hypothetical protein VHE09_13615 [Rhizomicrobium sp.]|nr:hypothetical protein [Rhizomicrobium sp.]
MEVHAPEHGIHTWRDFFVHMGTICLGLLIALGLEQAAEAVHHAHQRAELREALDIDSRQAIVDAKRSEHFSDQMIAWLTMRIAQVRTAIATKSAIPKYVRPNPDEFDLVIDPSFQAAKSSGLLALLPQHEIMAYSEADTVTADLAQAYSHLSDARTSLQQFSFRFRAVDGTPDYSHATAEEQERYLELLVGQLSGHVNFRFYNQVELGLQIALLRGERDLRALQKAERDLNTPAPGVGLKRM